MKYQLTESSDDNPEGLNSFISKANNPKPYEILPRLYTQNSLFHELNYKLYVGLDAELPASKADGSVLDYPGVPGEWSRLLNVMGVPHNPEGVPPYSTAGYHDALIASKGQSHTITNILDKDGRRRAKWLAKKMVNRSPPSSIHVKRVVVTGIPHMTSDIEVKYNIVKGWHERYEEYIDLLLSNRMHALADVHDIMFVYFVGRRYQPDKVSYIDSRAVGKDRIVLDWQGKWVVADKRLPDWIEEGQYRKYFLACRSRKISASPLGATYPLRIVAKEIEHYIDSVYEHTFYHTGAASLQRKIGDATDLYMADVDNHDVNMPPELRDIFCDTVGEAFGPMYGMLFRLTMRMPQLVKNDYRGGVGVKLQGNPYDINTFDASYVNASGHPATSLLAKYAGAFFPYDALVRAGDVEDTEDALERLLKGETDKKFLNAGDNLTVLGVEGGLERLQKFSPFCLYSSTSTFQGLVAVRVSGGSIRFYPNVDSLVLNYFVPGRSIGNPQRGHWANGWEWRTPVYIEAPGFQKAKEICNSVTKDVLGIAIDDYARLRKSIRNIVGRSIVDAEFEIDPDIIYYKRLPEEVSPDVLEQVYFTIEPRFYQRMHDYLLTKDPRHG